MLWAFLYLLSRMGLRILLMLPLDFWTIMATAFWIVLIALKAGTRCGTICYEMLLMLTLMAHALIEERISFTSQDAIMASSRLLDTIGQLSSRCARAHSEVRDVVRRERPGDAAQASVDDGGFSDERLCSSLPSSLQPCHYWLSTFGCTWPAPISFTLGSRCMTSY